MDSIIFFTYFGCEKKDCTTILKEYSFKSNSLYLLLSGELQMFSPNSESQIVRSFYSNYWIPYKNIWDHGLKEKIEVSRTGVFAEIWVRDPLVFNKLNVSVKILDGNSESTEEVKKDTLFYTIKSVADSTETFTINGEQKSSYFVQAEDDLILNISTIKPIYCLKITFE